MVSSEYLTQIDCLVGQLGSMERALQRARYKVAALLISLFAITYLDRVCISVAGPRMQADLHINPIEWGWVTGVFGLAYCLFEIPSGYLGDRIGSRRVLTRIVLWWSAFTALTGTMTRYVPLLITRFLFGAGEAGAFPNAGIVVSRWFPASQRATMLGVTLMAAQIGGAIAPLLVVPIQSHYGWRVSFFIFGLLGAVWALIWRLWFRDSPEEKLRLASTPDQAARLSHGRDRQFPWIAAFQSTTVWALLFLAFCYIYVYNFFQTWFHTFLVKGRGFSEQGLLLSALPYAVAICTNVLGGITSDVLVRKLGRTSGRRVLGVAALAAAGGCALAVMVTRNQLMTVVLLSLVYGAVTFQQSGACGVCLDISQKCAGAMVGLFNTASYLGGLVGAVAYGYIVDRFGSYDAPFVPMAALLLIGALLWLKIDASQELPAQAAAPVSIPLEVGEA